MNHTGECSRRHVDAERLSGINLNPNMECPRCRLNFAAPALLEALQEAERVIRWAAQEAAGRVKSEIVGGWLHHADKCAAAIAEATGRQCPAS